MSLDFMQALYNTYEQNKDRGDGMMPLMHTSTNADIEITIDINGNFISANEISKNYQKTIIPYTEASMSRTSGRTPHALADKIFYLAGDYCDYGFKIKKDPFLKYLKQIEEWADAEITHSWVQAIRKYVSKEKLVEDLLNSSGFKKSKIEKSFVRWCVQDPSTINTKTYENEELQKNWIRYYFDKQSKMPSRKSCYCEISHQIGLQTTEHAKGFLGSSANAKIMSSNDDTGYTFRGRVNDDSQCYFVSLESSCKIFSAFRWIKDRNQFFTNNSNEILIWSLGGDGDVVGVIENDDFKLFENEEESLDDIGQAYAQSLKKAILGFNSNFRNAQKIFVLGLDAATNGRASVVLFEELSTSNFFQSVELWHIMLSWKQKGFKKDKTSVEFIGPPSLNSIIELLTGQMQNSVSSEAVKKISKSYKSQLLECLLENKQIPKNILNEALRRVIKRHSFASYSKWDRALRIACSLYKSSAKEDYSMSLEVQRNTRDYLFGRLLAVADNLENRALYIRGIERTTNACNLTQAFFVKPYTTWRRINLAIGPYQKILKRDRPFFLFTMNNLMGEIHSLFQNDDYVCDKPLTGEALLGYYCQKQSFIEENKKRQQEKNSN